MVKYEVIYMPDGTTVACVFEENIGHIPIDEANSDYRAYLAWKAEQETA